MEDDRKTVNAAEVSLSISKKSPDNNGEHQLEQQTDERETDSQAEPTGHDGREDEGDSKAEGGERTATVSDSKGSTKSALAKKEERLKRLRELHLRRVRRTA